MTLAEIRRLVTNYSGRTDPDFLTNVDDMIRLGHRYVERAWLGREQYYTVWTHAVIVDPGQNLVALPKDYRPSAQLSVHVTPPDDPGHLGTILERVPIDAMLSDRPWRLSDGTVLDLYDVAYGSPRVYAVWLGRTVTFRPPNATALLVRLGGQAWSAPLTFDSDETVVSQQAPEAVLYAALREAWSFLGDPVQKATWEGEATRAIEAWMRDGTHQETAAQGLPLVMQVPG
jgi:hypothetical protein